MIFKQNKKNLKHVFYNKYESTCTFQIVLMNFIVKYTICIVRHKFSHNEVDFFISFSIQIHVWKVLMVSNCIVPLPYHREMAGITLIYILQQQKLLLIMIFMYRYLHVNKLLQGHKTCHSSYCILTQCLLRHQHKTW